MFFETTDFIPFISLLRLTSIANEPQFSNFILHNKGQM